MKYLMLFFNSIFRVAKKIWPILLILGHSITAIIAIVTILVITTLLKVAVISVSAKNTKNLKTKLKNLHPVKSY